MLSKSDAQIARLLKNRLQVIIPLKRMLVYGSRARGDASQDSDMDVFVEVSDITPQQRRLISEIAWEIGLDHEVVITTFVGSSAEIRLGPLSANPVMRAIEYEGVAV